MITHRILADEGITVVEPSSPLSKEDFVQLARAVDEYLETHSSLNGLLIYSQHFPGWEDFAGFVRHMKFVKEHHTKVKRVALVTDSKLGSAAPRLGSHFIAAEIRQFAFAAYEDALTWLCSE